MGFILRTGIILLDQVRDERLLPGRDVQLEESVQGVVDRAANEVATCNYPSREQTHNNVRYPNVYHYLLCSPPGPAKTRRAPSRLCRDARSMVIYDYGMQDY